MAASLTILGPMAIAQMEVHIPMSKFRHLMSKYLKAINETYKINC